MVILKFFKVTEIVRRNLPDHNEIPSSIYEAKKTLNALGMEYEKLHACPNDCIMYRNEYKDMSSCPTCGMSRWKVAKNSNKIESGVPAKVLWYFPFIPRFKRMFSIHETAKKLIWHAEQRKVDGYLCHPADSPS